MFQDRDKTRNLIYIFQNGEKEEAEKALAEIISLNDGLVRKIASRYQFYAEYEDLVQEGYSGLIRSAKSFDLNRNTEFSTYAVLWIEQCMRRYIPKTTGLHYSKDAYAKYVQLVQLNREIKAKQRAPMTDAEKMEELSMKPEVFFALQNGISPLSLNYCLNPEEDGSIELGDTIQSSDNVEEEVIDREIMQKFLFYLKEKLSAYEYEILKRRFGLEGTEKESLRQIARDYDVSAERIRQVEARALKKLKQPYMLNKIQRITGAFDYVRG